MIISPTWAETSLSYPQVATGQVKTYDSNGEELSGLKEGDSFYGQDGHYAKGAKMSFKDNGDGTITDLNTGLTWQKEPPTKGYSWQEAHDYCENLELGGHSDWRLPSAKELFSISDFSEGWPYVDSEYFKLVNNERVGKDEQYWTSNKYLGSIARGGHNGAFGVNHATGHIKTYSAGGQGGGREGGRARPQGGGREGGARPQGGGREGGGARPQGGGPQGDHVMGGERRGPSRGQGENSSGTSRPQGPPPQRGEQNMQQLMERFDIDKDGKLNEEELIAMQAANASRGPSAGGARRNPAAKQVRAVRGTPYGQNKFVDNGDGTISDKGTGLMWAKLDSKEGMDWQSALKYAESSELAGFTDWRLPNVKELQGIVDYNRAPNSSDPSKEGPAIDPIFECSDFTNAQGVKDYPYFWSSTSALFRKGTPHYYAWYVAFGRAVNKTGEDSHGAGGVRFDTKHKDGPAGEDAGRVFNYVRIVRDMK